LILALSPARAIATKAAPTGLACIFKPLSRVRQEPAIQK
jgi:hypothetical protein